MSDITLEEVCLMHMEGTYDPGVESIRECMAEIDDIICANNFFNIGNKLAVSYQYLIWAKNRLGE